MKFISDSTSFRIRQVEDNYKTALKRIENAKIRKSSRLDLYDLQLTRVPSEIGQLTQLTYLDLRYNCLSELPKEIINLTNLEVLQLIGNELKKLPLEITKLKKLKTLSLYDNQLERLPPEIGELENLQTLDLKNNKIKEIPIELSRLKNLRTLWLTDNCIRELPQDIASMQNLKFLHIHDNTIEKPPVEICEKGIEAIREYFTDLVEQGEDYVYEAKLVLVGEPGAGKTSLSKKLLNPENPLNINEPMTKGIEIKHWYFPYVNYADQSSELDNTENPFRTNIWDFGGQEIMHATHRYFLTKRSLYILLADNRKEDTDFYYWLNLVEILTDKSPTLIVLNEKYNHKKYVPEDILKRFAGVKQVVSVNLADNTGLEVLQKLIQDELRTLPHIGKEAIPKKWMEIRRHLEEENKDFITKNDYLKICYKYGIIDDNKAFRISEFLHDLGVILHFQNDILLQNTLILKNSWATEAVYMILFDEKIIAQGGKFDVKDVSRILNHPEYSGQQANVLQLMVNFEICYQITGCQSYIVPQLLPDKAPKNVHQIFNPNLEPDNIIHFEYYYVFMPKGIISRLIVRLNKYIHNQLQWKSGVFLHIDEALAEIIEYYPERILRIRIYGEGKRESLTIIRKEIAEIHESYNNLEYSEMIPCNCEGCRVLSKPHFYKYEVLKKYLRAGRTEIVCERFVEFSVKVQELIDGVFKKNEIDYNADIEFAEKIVKEKQLSMLKNQLDNEEKLCANLIIDFNKIENIKLSLDAKALNKAYRYKLAFVFAYFGIFVVLTTLIYIYGWARMEKYTFILGFSSVISGYIYLLFKGHSFNPGTIVTNMELKQRQNIYDENNFDYQQYESIRNQLELTEGKIKIIKNKISGFD